MAIREGAEKEKVSDLVQLYKKSLEPLLNLLNMRDAEILLSSDLENSEEYREALESVEESPTRKKP